MSQSSASPFEVATEPHFAADIARSSVHDMGSPQPLRRTASAQDGAIPRAVGQHLFVDWSLPLRSSNATDGLPDRGEFSLEQSLAGEHLAQRRKYRVGQQPDLHVCINEQIVL